MFDSLSDINHILSKEWEIRKDIKKYKTIYDLYMKELRLSYPILGEALLYSIIDISNNPKEGDIIMNNGFSLFTNTFPCNLVKKSSSILKVKFPSGHMMITSGNFHMMPPNERYKVEKVEKFNETVNLISCTFYEYGVHKDYNGNKYIGLEKF
jgi:hypothetical protein